MLNVAYALSLFSFNVQAILSPIPLTHRYMVLYPSLASANHRHTSDTCCYRGRTRLPNQNAFFTCGSVEEKQQQHHAVPFGEFPLIGAAGLRGTLDETAS